MLEKLRAELSRSMKIIKDDEEITPRFRVFTHDGDYIVFCPLPPDLEIRQMRIELVRRFMVWKLATGFITSTELIDPDSVLAIAVWRDHASGEIEARGIFRTISRFQTSIPMFSDEMQAGKEMAGDMLAMLPDQQESLSQDEIDELEKYMGVAGNFVVHKLKSK